MTPRLRITDFRKSMACPPSATLLDYARSQNAYEDRSRISAHLAVCDFCGAELQLLSHYPADNEECKIVNMPPHLRSLAERLLNLSGEVQVIEMVS